MDRVELLEVRVAAVTLHRNEAGAIEETRVGPMLTLQTADDFRNFREKALAEVAEANAALTPNRAARRLRARVLRRRRVDEAA